MKPAKIVFTVLQGGLEGKEYEFEEATECTVGRAADCTIRVPEDWFHIDVSRHHCVFEIDPPTVWVRDLQSHNGTFVNNENIGRLARVELPDDGNEGAAYELKDGDEVRIGHLVFRVDVVNTADVEDSAQVPMYFV